MTADQIISDFGARGVTFQAAGDRLRYNALPGVLTDEDRHLIQCYKTELLWRLRHPEGDPGPEGYSAKVFVNGERVAIPLDQLITQGKAIMERENIPPSKIFDLEMQAASIALSRYDDAHREWAEANGAYACGAAK